MNDVIIQHMQQDGKGAFFIGDEDERQAEMTYTLPEPGKMVIQHTEVGEALRGKNIGYQLVHAAVENARHNQLHILPICPFAASVFKKKPEFQDILYTEAP
jgi:predicted GNAT family acetyltransferase